MGFPDIPAPRGGRTRPVKTAPAAAGPHHLPERGLTLVELMVVVMVVAMLAMIAYPGYVGYKVRANRSAAQAFLIDLANRQQLYLVDARGYAASLARLGIAETPADLAPYYTIADPVVDNAASPPTFVLRAQARPGSIQARDGDLSLDATGARSGHW